MRWRVSLTDSRGQVYTYTVSGDNFAQAYGRAISEYLSSNEYKQFYFLSVEETDE